MLNPVSEVDHPTLRFAFYPERREWLVHYALEHCHGEEANCSANVTMSMHCSSLFNKVKVNNTLVIEKINI